MEFLQDLANHGREAGHVARQGLTLATVEEVDLVDLYGVDPLNHRLQHGLELLDEEDVLGVISCPEPGIRHHLEYGGLGPTLLLCVGSLSLCFEDGGLAFSFSRKDDVRLESKLLDFPSDFL